MEQPKGLYFVSFTAKGQRVNELMLKDHLSFRKAVAIANGEFSNFRPIPDWITDAPRFGHNLSFRKAVAIANGEFSNFRPIPDWITDAPRFGHSARGVLGFYLANGLAPDHPVAIPRAAVAEALDIPEKEIEGAMGHLQKICAIRITPQFSGNIRSADLVSLCDGSEADPPHVEEACGGLEVRA